MGLFLNTNSIEVRMTQKWHEITHGQQTNRILSRLSNHILGKYKKDGTVIFEREKSLDTICKLANAYGYLLNVQINVKKTFVLERRLSDLEHLAGLTKKLMPADSKFVLRN